MHVEILKSLTLPAHGKPVKDLTDAEKLGLYVAAGHPVETASKTGPNHEMLVTLKSAWPFGIYDNGVSYVVSVNPNAPGSYVDRHGRDELG